MTDEEHEELLNASQPVPYLVFGGIPPESPRDKAMRVWSKIANRVGCHVDTIAPANTGDDYDFDAVQASPAPRKSEGG